MSLSNRTATPLWHVLDAKSGVALRRLTGSQDRQDGAEVELGFFLHAGMEECIIPRLNRAGCGSIASGRLQQMNQS